MSTKTRRAFGRQLHFGLREPKDAPALKFKSFWTGIVPPHPVKLMRLDRFSFWQMFDNDIKGTCFPATCANYVRVISNGLSTEYYPALSEVLAFYATQNKNGQDGGMDMQTGLEEWHRTQWFGRKLVAFAQVDHSDLEEVKAAIAIFGGVLFGVRVQQANEADFYNGCPWDYDPDSVEVGLHAVYAGDYLGDPLNDIRMVTWAELTGMTDRYASRQTVMVWIPILPEHLGTRAFQEGVNQELFRQYYRDLTGDVLMLPDVKKGCLGKVGALYQRMRREI